MVGSLGALVKATGAVLVVRAADVAFMGAAPAWADGAIASVMRGLGGQVQELGQLAAAIRALFKAGSAVLVVWAADEALVGATATRTDWSNAFYFFILGCQFNELVDFLCCWWAKLNS